MTMLRAKERSIRFRLTLWYSLALGAGLSLFALATWLLLWHSLATDLDRTLSGRVQSIARFLTTESAEPHINIPEEVEEYASAFPPGTYLRLVNPRGAVAFVSNAPFPWARLLSVQQGIGRVRLQHHSYRVIVAQAPVDGQVWRIAIATNIDELEAMLNRLRMLLLILLPAVALVAILGGHWLSRRALRPVDEIREAASGIGIGNLSTRLAVPRTNDELQRLSETFNGMLTRIESAVRRLSRFTADASHELRTPLAVIRATAEIANRKSRSAEEYRSSLARVAAESERMTGILEDLLFLAHCDSNAVEMPLSPVDLAAVVDDVQAELRTLAASRAIDLSFRQTSATVHVLANETALRRLVIILLDNAIKFSDPGGEVTVSLRGDPGGLALEVRDNGPGIPAEDLPHIFERFYRSSRARELGIPGSGLGLALGSGIAQQHHTQIQVESTPGRGSCFRIVLAASAAAPALAEEPTCYQSGT
ncbi:MAG TPA: ATP-binding protein [Bryobacteraceae bacterium]|nr:ATP-binding protein [Bryobacteraceae bacterium]